MKKFLLLRSQKNKIFELVRKAELNPFSLEWREEPTDYPSERYLVSVLRQVGGDSYFKFDRSPSGHYFYRLFPGDHGLEEGSRKKFFTWGSMLDKFAGWLPFLEPELAPDLWEQLKEYAPHETFIGTAEISNAPFSNVEAGKIIESLNKLQAQIEENFNLQGNQLAFLKREIKYLKEAVKRQGRKDWMHTFIGVMVTLATGLALSPEKAKLLWDLVRSCFAGLLPLPAP